MCVCVCVCVCVLTQSIWGHSCTCVSRECMDTTRLTRTIVEFPDPLIPSIAPRVYRIIHVHNLNLD